MRGNVYRLSGRRAGSIVLSLGAALTLALGWASAATAKAAKVPVKTTTVVYRSSTGVRPSTTAHAAGHKIA
jgi:hypothetical protein